MTSSPQPGRARRSSRTDSPSPNQRGTLPPVAPVVTAWAISCQSVEPQLKCPIARADGESMASTLPKLTPERAQPGQADRAHREVAVARIDLEADGSGRAEPVALGQPLVGLLGQLAHVGREQLRLLPVDDQREVRRLRLLVLREACPAGRACS